MTKKEKYNLMVYRLGVSDGMGHVLTETKNKVKLPNVAIRYKKLFGEQHPTHKWHMGQ